MRIDRNLAYTLAPKAPAHVESQVFADDTTSEFGLVMLGMGEERWQYPDLANLWHELRHNVYDAHDYLGHSTIEDGREFDDDDDRAIHLLVMKRLRPQELIAIAGMRCMIKESMERPLPIEQYFSHVFDGAPLPVGGIETSRLISVELHLAKQRLILQHLFATAYADALGRVGEFRYSYGVMGDDLESTLPRFVGLPITRISDEVPVPYGTEDIAIQADMATFRKNYGEEAFGQLSPIMGQAYRWGSIAEASDV